METQLIEPGRPIRLIVDPPADGGWNMAVDESLLGSAADGITTLRFYQWRQPTLSLGYFQSLVDRHQHPASRDCPVVRRSSGGGAIVHDRELTYSFSCPVQRLDTRRFYQEMHDCLQTALAHFKVPVELWQQDQPSRQPDPFLCFQRRSPGDMVSGNVKIAGSAQRRRRGALLQHGSVLLETSCYAPELPSIASDRDIPLQFDELVEQYCLVLKKRWQIELVPGTLDTVETNRASQIESEKFANIAWTKHRNR